MSTANATPHGSGVGPNSPVAAPSERARERSERAARFTERQERNNLPSAVAWRGMLVYSGGWYSTGRHKAPALPLVFGVALSSGGRARPGRVIPVLRLIRELRPRVCTALVGVCDRAVSGSLDRGSMSARRVGFWCC